MSLARMFGWVVFCVPMALAGVVACSSSDDSKPADSANQCASQTTVFDCDICCGLVNYYLDLKNAGDDCVCDDACKTECGPACDPNGTAVADDACNACANSDKAKSICQPKVQAVCDKDPECTKAQNCARAAGCGDKPEGTVDGGTGDAGQ